MLNATNNPHNTDVAQSSFSWLPWLIWGSATLFVFFQFLLQVSPSVMIVELMQSLHIDLSSVGVLSSAFYYTYVVLQMPAGILVDRFGARRLLILGLIFLVSFSFLFSMITSFKMGIGLRMAMGIVATPGIVATLFLAGRWFSPRYFALVAGLTEMLGMIGGAIGQPLLSQFVHRSLGWRNSMMILALFGGAVLLLIIVLVRDEPATTFSTHAPIQHDTVSCNLLHGLSEILLRPQAWIVGFYSGFMFAVVITFAGLWAIPFFKTYYAINVSSASFLAGAIFLGAGIGSPLTGWFSDRAGYRRTPMILSAFATLIIFCVMLFMSGIPIQLMFILAFLLGCCSSGYMLPFAVMGDQIPRHVYAATMGFINMMCLLIPAPLLQPLIGQILETRQQHHHLLSLHDYQYALSFLVLAISLACILSLFTRETYCGRYQSSV